MTTLCKLKKKDIIGKEAKLIYHFIHNAEYVCEKCLRSAAKKKSLCKPIPLKSLIS